MIRSAFTRRALSLTPEAHSSFTILPSYMLRWLWTTRR
uniref:Uncharacterized protein MANES_02G182800 n=1 Tax=Rhizophora mucronata TaxID=61149 RepID=A0A2P2IYT3_RHIMU